VKRVLVAATAVAAALALSSCGAVEDTKTAATVGSSEVTVDQLQRVIEALGKARQVPIDPATDTVDGERARVYLTAMIQARANEQFLALNGEQITDADRQAALSQLTTPIPDGVPDEVVRLIADSQATSTVQQRIPIPAADVVPKAFGEGIDLGLVCVRQVVAPTEDAANDLVDELAAGATIADLADRSIDAASKATGGEVQDDSGSPCLVVPQAAQVLGSEVVEALVDAMPGEIVGPVRGAGGWHVLQLRPYDEVSDAANTLLQQYGGQLLFVGFLSRADVSVDPRYGRWDPARGSVIAL
jgi:parvulin-like peptidyl-prolyl isomerase